jgi:hypothetical protein
MRKKKATAFIIDCKVKHSYSVSLFSNLIFINNRRYSIDHVFTFGGSSPLPYWMRLERFIHERMLDINWLDWEFLLIGTFRKDDGKKAKHASTFVRLEVGPLKLPVVAYLDSNCDQPHSTDPKLLGHFSVSSLINWERLFGRYTEIMLYKLEEHIVIDMRYFNSRFNFIKGVIEGS